MTTKVCFFFGGVFSSLGKGLTLANLGRIFKELGFKVSVLKFDPYLNIDSGSLSPIQHGEVYVTADGHETDLDLGHYERFLERELTHLSCITSGKIYQRLLNKKQFSGKTIQVIPHLTDEINEAIYQLIESEPDSDFLFIEIGGTVGDIESMPFMEAANRFRHKHGKENVMFIHISPILHLSTTNEYKTKPTQHSIRKLFSHNIFPDILILRSSFPIPDSVNKKLSIATQINEDCIFHCPDSKNIYLIAEGLYKEKVHEKILEKFGMQVPNKNIDSWKKKTEKILSKKDKHLKIAITGKYSSVSDSYISILESFKLASYALGIELTIDCLNVEGLQDLSPLKEYSAICVPHGFGNRGIQDKIRVIEHCRVHKVPFLGICLGLQLALLEYTRNVLGKTSANSSEMDPNTPMPLFIPFEESIMRLGKHRVRILEGTKAHKLFGLNLIESRHRHRYHMNNKYFELFKDQDLVLSAFSDDEKKILEMVELKNHPFFVATQFHPEFETKFSNISCLFIEFLKSGLTYSEK